MRSDVGRGALRTRALATACLVGLARTPRRVRRRRRRQRRSPGLERGPARHQAPGRVQGRRRQGASDPRKPRAQAGPAPRPLRTRRRPRPRSSAPRKIRPPDVHRVRASSVRASTMRASSSSARPTRRTPTHPPTTRPTSRDSTTCAARSNIVQAMQAAQSANDNLTPAQIKLRNKGYLVWRSCMIDRGWKIAEPVPDSQGRLFNFGSLRIAEPDRRRRPGRTCSRARTSSSARQSPRRSSAPAETVEHSNKGWACGGGSLSGSWRCSSWAAPSSISRRVVRARARSRCSSPRSRCRVTCATR